MDHDDDLRPGVLHPGGGWLSGASSAPLSAATPAQPDPATTGERLALFLDRLAAALEDQPTRYALLALLGLEPTLLDGTEVDR